MATVDEVKRRTRELIAELLPDVFPENIEDDTVLSAEGNVDSMGFILILTKLEGEFNAYVPDETWGDLRTLDDVARAIVENVQPEGGAAAGAGCAAGDTAVGEETAGGAAATGEACAAAGESRAADDAAAGAGDASGSDVARSAGGASEPHGAR